MKFYTICTTVTLTLFVLLYTPNALALIQTPDEIITITPINEKISIEKTVTIMNVPTDSNLVWGAVKGEPSNYAERYPVIIQFFKGDEAIHMAQVKVKGDGSYEYKFRIRSVDQNTFQIIDIFEGKYTVKIFRVLNTNQI